MLYKKKTKHNQPYFRVTGVVCKMYYRKFTVIAKPHDYNDNNKERFNLILPFAT